MKISVVIPCRDRPDQLLRAIASVRSQNVAVHEIIVVDDGSVHPISLPPEMSGDVAVLRNARSLGASEARNVGLRAATGDIVAFLDSDDTWERLHTAVVLEHILDGAHVVVTGSTTVTDSGARRTSRRSAGTLTVDRLLSLRQGLTPTSCIAFDARALQEPHFDVALESLEDYEFVLRSMIDGHEARRVPERTVVREGRGDDHLYSTERAVAAMHRMIDRHSSTLSRHPRAARAFRLGLLRRAIMLEDGHAVDASITALDAAGGSLVPLRTLGWCARRLPRITERMLALNEHLPCR